MGIWDWDCPKNFLKFCLNSSKWKPFLFLEILEEKQEAQNEENEEEEN